MLHWTQDGEDKIGLELVLCGQHNGCLASRSRVFPVFKGILEINMRVIKIHDLGRSI